jgi:hypothetical protein
MKEGGEDEDDDGGNADPSHIHIQEQDNNQPNLNHYGANARNDNNSTPQANQ